MSSVIIAGDTSGSISLTAPAVAGTTVLTLPTSNGTVITTSTLTSSGVAQLAVAETFTAPQRGTVITNNTLSFDLSTGNNFFSTPTAGGTLTFTNHTAGQSGYILFVNSSNYAISAAATTKVGSTLLSTISITGTYLISYFDNGTNTYITSSGILS